MRRAEVDTCLVCHNTDCARHGSAQLAGELRTRLVARGSAVVVQPYFCFGACAEAANVVLYPEGTWYSKVALQDVGEIVDHILGGPAVARLTGHVDPALQRLILELIDSGLGRFTA